jgi:hypothetical protein
MNPTAEDLHHRIDQLRLLASETDDPLAQRLVRDMIVELEDMLRDHGALASDKEDHQRQARRTETSMMPEKLKRKN